MRRFVKSAFLVLSAAVTVSLASAQTASARDWLVDGIQGPSFMPAGGVASYLIGVRNNGSETSPVAHLEATIPAGTSFVPSATPPSSECFVSGDVVRCDLPALDEDEAINFTLDFLTTDEGVLKFIVEVPYPDSISSNNTETVTTTINRGADLQLEIEAPDEVVSGDGIAYTLRIANNGPHTADNFTVNFPAPVGVANLVAPANCTLVAGTYSCEISEPLAPDEDITLNFSGQAAAAANSTITVQASITGQSPADPFSDNDVVEVSTEVNAGSDLAISKTRTPGGTILQGSQVVFTLAGSYTGEAPGGQITVTDVLPAAYTYVSHNAPAEWTCDFASGTLTCTRPAPDTGAGADISLGAIALHVTASDTGTPTNTADITAANTEDPNPANNSASVDATIEAPFIDLAASKSGPRPALVVVGQEFDFTLGARNLGNAGFTGTVQMTDRVPAGMTISAAAGEAWQCGPLPVSGPADLVCDIVYTAENPLPAQGATPALTLTATSGNEGPMRNSAQVSGIGGNYLDENPVNDTATYNVDVSVDQDSADVSVEKAALRPSLPAGEEQTFQITVRNAGPDIAQNVEVTDLLTDLINTDTGPDNGLVSAVWSTPVPGGGTPPINTTPEGGGLMLRSTIPALPVCNADCPVLTVTITVGGDGGTRTNTVDAVSQTTADPNWPNGTATATYDVESRVDVTLTKTATPDPVAVGQPLSFVLTATNEGNGLSRAHDVTVTDTLPHGLMFLSAEPSTGSCSVTPAAGSETGPGNDQLVCNLGNLNNGAQQTVKIQTRPMLVLNGETVTNTATVTTTTTELDETNNDAEVTVTVAPPLYDLIVAKIDTEDPVTVGEDTIYVITITNNGPSAAENVVMTDTLPATLLSFQGHTPPADATCGTVPQTGDYGGELICTIPYMSSGSSREFTVTMRGEAKGSVTNVVSVTADGPQWEINQGNNTASQNTTVRTRVDLEVVSKTAEPGTVPLREHFKWKIFLRNNVNETYMLAEADDVVFTDNLPAGMVLTGPPSAEATVGSITRNVCTGEEGDTSISCEFGTMSKGAEVYVTLPVMVTDITTDGQEFINGADIATSSYDRVTSNNTNTGKVTITAGSISGSVWRDFNANGSRDANDSGLDSITLTLNGTDLHDVAFTRTTQTAADGNYTFGLLPEGDYTITRTGPTPEHHEDLAALPGPNGGTASGATVIANISLDAEADVTDYDFTLRPIARLGLAKAASEPVLRDVNDGSFTFNFEFVARNYSLEPLKNISITDTMAGGLPGFGTYNANAASLQPGEYHAAATGTCDAVNPGFNGADSDTLLSGLSLAAESSCTVTVVMTVRPEIPLPYVADDARRYINQATITGEGAWSGQTSPGNENLNNLSHNGNNPDPNNNGIPNEAGSEDTPTPVGITYAPKIALVKLIDETDLSTPVVAGDTVTYSFTVTNTGNVPLVNITLEDDKIPALSANTVAQLLPGETSTTFTETYSLTADDVAAGEVVNQATATGTWGLDGSGNPETVDDVSGATVDDDEPTILTMGDISLVKTANTAGFSDPVMAGDVLRWSFTVTNNGSATLQNVLVSDTIDGVDVTGAAITLAPGESDSTNFTAEYTLTQEDIDAGSFTNAASVIGYYGEDGGDHYPVTDDDTVTTPLPAKPEISLIKAATSALTDPAVLGQEISYSFTIENTGNVTLSDITLADLLDGIEFNDGEIATLAPGDVDSDAFSATYAITQADIDRGFVTNEATVTGNFTDAGGTLHQPQDTDDTRTEVAQDAQIRLVKLSQTSLTAPVEIGDEIEYAFEISNIGNVTLTNIRITDNIATVTGGPITLAPEATDELTFTAVYAITAEDIEAGFVDNTATVFGDYTDGSGTTQTVDDISGNDVDNDTPTTVTIPQSPAIALIKRADVSGLSSPPAVDDLVRYTFEVVNTGNVTLTGIEIEDLLPGIDVSGGPLASLAPGGVDTETFEASYPLTQADLDRGYVENTATVTGTHTDPDENETEVTDTSGTDVENNTPTVAPIVQLPQLELVKTPDISGVSTPAEVGNVITWSFTVTNTGNVTLTDVTLTDLLDGITLDGEPIESLAPQDVDDETFTASYTLTQEDLDRGFVDNFATVTGTYTDPEGDPQQVDAEDDTHTDLAQNPELELIKTANTSAVSEPAQLGDVITWSFTVTNTGNVTLSDVAITDDLVDELTGGPITLAPGAVDETTFSASYALKQADIDNGFFANLATVTGTYTDPEGDPQQVEDEDETRSDLVQNAQIALLKEADASALNSPAEVGDEISYAFSVTNTGNVTLTGITLADLLPDIELDGGPIASLAPEGVDDETFSAVYTLTQDDLDRGYVDNFATVTGHYTDGEGDPQEAEAEDETRTDITQLPGLDLQKEADTTGVNDPAQVGDVISYAFTITNTGNVTLTDITLADDLDGIQLIGGPITSLAPEAVDDTTFTASYTLTQEDLDRGYVDNFATVTGIHTDPEGDPHDVEAEDEVRSDVPQEPMLELLKEADASGVSDPAEVGQEIRYAFTITNTGNVTLTDVTLTDLLDGIELTGAPIPSLAPGDDDGDTYAASYTLTQADLDAGFVANFATATGTHTDGDGNTGEVDAEGETRTDIAQDAQIVLIKTSDNSGLGDPVQVGDEISYGFEIINTGNVTLTGITLSDDIADVLGGPIASLAPGESDDATFTATYAVTAADIEAGFVDNTALATGTYTDGSGDPQEVSDISGTDVDNDHPTRTEILQSPAIALIKTADDTAVNIPAEVGDIISYAFEVVNTGNVTLTDITLEDLLEDISLIGGPIPTLAPGENDTTTFSATYAVKQTDLNRGYVENTATVTGTHTDPEDIETPVEDTSGTTVDDDEPTRVDLVQSPGITLVKIADDDGVSSPAAVGDLITYSFHIRNSGSITLKNVTLEDDLPGLMLTGAPIAELAPGDEDTTTYRASYALTQADLDRGYVENTAITTGDYTDGDGNPGSISDISGTDTDNDTETVIMIEQGPAIALVKTADDSQLSTVLRVGDELRYNFAVTNTGNVTLTDITLTDDLPGIILSGGPITSLAPGVTDATTFTAVYYLTADDLEAQQVTNSALVTGVHTPPTGEPEDVTDISGTDITNDDPTVTPLPVEADVTASKTASTDRVVIGDTVTYTLAFTNESPRSLRDVIVVDRLPEGTVYTPETALVGGVAVEPEVSGRFLRWQVETVAAGATLEVQLSVRITGAAPYGPLVNQTWMVDETGTRVSNIAEARVLREPEHVFECTDIIGTVFDDRNMNGYQDPIDGPAHGLGANAPEPGVAGVRLVTPTGTIITTDEFGRFHVPCAELPRAGGANFTLKLDTRSLPSGYRVTTENPRTIRVTAGRMAKLNFGVAIAQVVRLDLSAAAYDADGTPGAALAAGITATAAQLGDKPVVVRLSYRLPAGGDSRAAWQHIDNTEALVRREWRGRLGPLLIERTIQREE